MWAQDPFTWLLIGVQSCCPLSLQGHRTGTSKMCTQSPVHCPAAPCGLLLTAYLAPLLKGCCCPCQNLEPRTQSRLTWVAGCVTFSAYSFSSCSVPITAGIFGLVVQPSAQPGIAVPAGKANEGLADGNSLLSWPCCTSP